MSDQIVDALVGVLPSLVRGDQFRIEGPDTLSALDERGPQPGIFRAELVMRFDQRPDRALESIKVAGFRGCSGNEEIPRCAAILPGTDGIRQAIVEESNDRIRRAGRQPKGCDQTALRSIKRTLGLRQRSVHQFAKSVGVIGKEPVHLGFEAAA